LMESMKPEKPLAIEGGYEGGSGGGSSSMGSGSQ
jgi:hypothetical protein